MKKFNINYSTKNIPIPPEQEYMIQLISKVEKFIRCNSGKENYGFKIRKCPPNVDELVDFENDMMKTKEKNNTEFKKIKYTFQTKLMSDIKKIYESNDLLIPPYKSRNIYIIQKDDYNKYVRHDVTKTYKHSTANRV